MRAFAWSCVVAAILPLLPRTAAERPVAVAAEDVEWPTTFDDVALEPLRLSASEAEFSADFPGAIARFAAGDREIVVRTVTEATRRLHPAADCLRATGYDVTATGPVVDERGRLWASSIARKGDRSWRVRERIVDQGSAQVFTDASSWWWAAVLERSVGPWWAWTVLEPNPADR
ncbi:MAG: hypothetical protein IPH13_08635 [Planctomycetes bacterium]|nr:hypothetical protein [Planctomycetota bacterium]MCC7173003.1 hypothetical protein [Planctomycetota bacterium]